METTCRCTAVVAERVPDTTLYCCTRTGNRTADKNVLKADTGTNIRYCFMHRGGTAAPHFVTSFVVRGNGSVRVEVGGGAGR